MPKKIQKFKGIIFRFQNTIFKRPKCIWSPQLWVLCNKLLSTLKIAINPPNPSNREVIPLPLLTILTLFHLSIFFSYAHVASSHDPSQHYLHLIYICLNFPFPSCLTHTITNDINSFSLLTILTLFHRSGTRHMAKEDARWWLTYIENAYPSQLENTCGDLKLFCPFDF